MLSGGAWQSIIIASLDERIAATIPACGYFSFTSAIERNSDVGDMEYHPHDLFIDGDYSVLTAMMAPRPTMLIYGAVDEYGLRAPLGFAGITVIDTSVAAVTARVADPLMAPEAA